MEEWINKELDELRAQDLERRIRAFPVPGGKIAAHGKEWINFSSNDYLGLARNKDIIRAATLALKTFGAGAGASRLLTGTLLCHEELERRLAEFKGYAAALVFGSGYLANAGAISALVGRRDEIFADKLVHASIVDAAALSRAKLYRFHHNDPERLAALLRRRPRAGKRLIVTESVFSMDGDLAPLVDIAAIARDNNALCMVDEAHATGIFGPRGSGLVRAFGLERSINVSMGTLSKALGGYGGFIACSIPMRELLINRARAFVFSTGLPPAMAGAALKAIDILHAKPDIGAALLENAAFLRARLRNAGLDTGNSASQIIPIILGDAKKALSLSARLEKKGILALPIRPPTVPVGTARIRLSVTLAHTRDDLEKAAEIIIACAKTEGPA